VDHHSFQLGQHRVFSSQRELMLYKNYTYLRDGQSTGFQDIKLMSHLTERLMAHVYGNSQLGGNTNKNPSEIKKWAYTHCRGEFHDGGSAKCVLKEYETKKARAMAKQIDKLIAAGATDKTKAIQEVIDAA
jgi:polygalacturonase